MDGTAHFSTLNQPKNITEPSLWPLLEIPTGQWRDGAAEEAPHGVKIALNNMKMGFLGFMLIVGPEILQEFCFHFTIEITFYANPAKLNLSYYHTGRACSGIIT